MVSSHTEASSCLCFLHLVNISVLGPRISSKPFFLSLGIKKKSLTTAPPLYKFIIYTPTDFRGEK